jgi:hypothetical protein
MLKTSPEEIFKRGTLGYETRGREQEKKHKKNFLKSKRSKKAKVLCIKIFLLYSRAWDAM